MGNDGGRGSEEYVEKMQHHVAGSSLGLRRTHTSDTHLQVGLNLSITDPLKHTNCTRSCIT
jgi:hypothetical protein